jgi:predicted secreted acid phosphatase
MSESIQTQTTSEVSQAVKKLIDDVSKTIGNKRAIVFDIDETLLTSKNL